MNMSEQHYDIDELLLYLEKPDAIEYRRIRIHLVHCKRCLKKAQELSHLELMVKQGEIVSAPQSTMQLFKHHAQQIFVSVKKSLHPVSLKNRLSYFLPLAVNALPKFFYKYLLTVAFPSVIIITIATIALRYSGADQFTISIYQNSPYMTFIRENTPGIGFFTNGNINRVPYKTASVTWQDNLFSMSWKRVKNTSSYEVLVETSTGDSQKIVAHITSSTNYFEIKNINLSPQTNYQYIISGKTDFGIAFKTSGGFIF